MKYAWIDAQRGDYGLNEMCRLLDVSESGYRAWQRGGKAERKRLTDAQMLALIKSIHAEFKGSYGSPRMVRQQKAGTRLSNADWRFGPQGSMFMASGLGGSSPRRGNNKPQGGEDMPHRAFFQGTPPMVADLQGRLDATPENAREGERIGWLHPGRPAIFA